MKTPNPTFVDMALVDAMLAEAELACPPHRFLHLDIEAHEGEITLPQSQFTALLDVLQDQDATVCDLSSRIADLVEERQGLEMRVLHLSRSRDIFSTAMWLSLAVVVVLATILLAVARA